MSKQDLSENNPVIILSGNDINHALLMQAHLIGWCTGTLSSVASLTVITCSNLFNVASLKIAFGENLFVVILFSIFGGGILGILNIII